MVSVDPTLAEEDANGANGAEEGNSAAEGALGEGDDA